MGDLRRKMNSWSELKYRLLDRFELTQEGTICERFSALRREGTVRDFRQIFEALASVLPVRLEHLLEGVFINGLQPEIHVGVRLIVPKRLEDLREYAQRVEDCNWTLSNPALSPQPDGPH